ncbi:NAD(P)H-binding protein [uncultured Psychroserpens sp.]|uniref:NAD(P)H-binding protein n=1 Tax=uncultured Psychroserpens sp. TaxID=255436 RepID=UPI002628F95A|nr:NAD(P)H-binding protein [uncultured Psychroserpens sp.]
MRHKICVIGCGWLGFELAKQLLENDYQVNGSTTSEDKIPKLEQANITPFIIQLSLEGVIGNIEACLDHCEILIVNIPPGLRKNPEHNYVQQMIHLVKHIETASVKHVVLIGSTSVYDDDETCPIITEDTPTSKSKTASKLVMVERLFQQNKNFDTTLLRFSGLFAEDRHPARFLSGKQNLKNADAPVNLIHRNDCIGIILSIIKQQAWSTTLNASTLPHPTKKAYYTSVCKAMNIPVPEFDESIKSKGKYIDSQKLVRVLNYDFKVKL